jgi:hypothetical protein
MFSLYLYSLLKEGVGEENFCLVGDDIVSTPCSILYDLKFRVSKLKSLSGPYSEFCGTIIDIHGDLHVRRNRVKDPLDHLVRFGLAITRFHFRSSIVRKAKALRSLPAPIGHAKGLGLFARLPGEAYVDFLELYTKPPIIPEWELSEQYIESRKMVWNPFISAVAEEDNDSYEVFREDTLPVHRLSSVNRVIQHMNVSGQYPPEWLWSLYGLSPMSRSQLMEFPQRKPQTGTLKQRGIHSMYRKIRRVLFPFILLLPLWAEADVVNYPTPVGETVGRLLKTGNSSSGEENDFSAVYTAVAALVVFGLKLTVDYLNREETVVICPRADEPDQPCLGCHKATNQ